MIITDELKYLAMTLEQLRAEDFAKVCLDASIEIESLQADIEELEAQLTDDQAAANRSCGE